MSIDEKQQKIIEDFSFLDLDAEMKITYLNDLGEKLPPLDDAFKRDEFLIKGCQAKVWITGELKGGKVNFYGDSNASTTKGLVALLFEVLNGESPQDICNAEIFFHSKIGWGNFMTNKRSIGLTNMIDRMKLYASDFSSKTQTGA